MKLIYITITSDIVIINLIRWSLINHCHDDDQPFQDDRACGAESAGGCSDCRTEPRIWISPRSPRKKVFAAHTKKYLVLIVIYIQIWSLQFGYFRYRGDKLEGLSDFLICPWMFFQLQVSTRERRRWKNVALSFLLNLGGGVMAVIKIVAKYHPWKLISRSSSSSSLSYQLVEWTP